MTKYLPLLAAGLLAAITAFAQPITIDTVFVADAGNTGEVQSQGTFGAVGYDYYIGTYEVTNSQYAAFLNAAAATDTHGLYNEIMGSDTTQGGITRNGNPGSYTYSVKSGFENKPVNYVSFWDAARFSNWLTTGNTETGVYNLNGTTAPTNNTITRDTTAWENGGVAVASENEWYKAAYYSGSPTGADGDGYWLYPTQSNSITTADANYANSVGNVTSVGTYAADPSHYGTFDQGGNVHEWNDTIVLSSNRGVRGGTFFSSFFGLDIALQSSDRSYGDPTSESNGLGYGFRVSSLSPITATTTYLVTFDLDGKGTRISGGELSQTINEGDAAVAPVVDANSNFVFTGWDVAFDNITADLTVTAIYKRFLDPSVIPENATAGTFVGRLRAFIYTPEETVSYSLVDGPGDDHNAYFQINGDVLEVAYPLDFEVTPTASVRVLADDGMGNTVEQALTVKVLDVGELGLEPDVVIRHRIPMPDGVGDSFFGPAAICGDWIAIGAYQYGVESGNGDAGRVYLYHFDGTSWVNDAPIILEPTAPTLRPNAEFGVRLDMWGNYLIVGAWQEDVQRADDSVLGQAGAAYIFERGADDTWTQVARLVAGTDALGYDGSANDDFGQRVAIWGEWAAVSTMQRAGDRGAVYLYQRDANGQWGTPGENGTRYAQQRILSQSQTINRRFGSDISIYDDWLAVGANELDASTRAGYVELFERDANGVWNYHGTLDHPDGSNPEFGSAVALHEGALLAGAPNRTTYSPQVGTSGVAFAYDFDGSDWVHAPGVGAFGDGGNQVDRLRPQNRVSGAEFGSHIKRSGDYALITAEAENSSRGSAYLFENLPDGSWAEVDAASVGLTAGQIRAQLDVDPFTIEAQSSDRFVGYAMDGRWIVAGSRFEDTVGDNAGAAYIYEIVPRNHRPTGITLNNDRVGVGRPADTKVGDLLADDLDAGDTFTFEVIDGPGSNASGDFTVINDNELVTATVFTDTAEFTCRIRVTDSTGNTFEDLVTVYVDSDGQITEMEPNDTPETAQEIPHDQFNLQEDPNILDSTVIPHVTLTGTGDGTEDHFSLVVPEPGGRVIIDIDGAYDEYALDTQILVRPADNLSTGWDVDDASSTDSGSLTVNDPFLDRSLGAGTWILSVLKSYSQPLPASTGYTMHISMENIDLPGYNVPPVALISGGSIALWDHDGDGQVVTLLDGSNSFDVDGQLVGWDWSWTRSSGPQSAQGATAEVTFSVTEADFFDVELLVTDDQGGTAVDTNTVAVLPNNPPTARISDGDDNLISEVLLEDSDDDGSEAFTLFGHLSSDGGTSSGLGIVSWEWTWEDSGAQSATGETIDASFPVGTTEVTLTVTDAGGLTHMASITIMVEAVLSYTVTFDLGTNGTRTGGGELSQSVEEGEAAVAPLVDANDNFVFTGWDVAFDTITADLKVTAQYEADDDNDGVGNSAEVGGSGGATIAEDVSGRTYEITNTEPQGTQVRVRFDETAGNISFAATDETADQQQTNPNIRAAWRFDTDLTPGVPVELSFNVGALTPEEQALMQVLWEPEPGAGFQVYAADDLTYDAATGFATFTVTGFSAYAIVIPVVPEPALAAAVLGLAALMLARRRR